MRRTCSYRPLVRTLIYLACLCCAGWSSAQAAGPPDAGPAENANERDFVPPANWVFNGRGQKTDQVKIVDLNRETVLYPISLNNHWGLINRFGDLVVYPYYDWMDYSFEGYARYVRGSKTGFLVVNPQPLDGRRHDTLRVEFDYADRFFGGLAVVMNEGRWGMIEQSGRLLVPLAYDGVLRFQDGFAAVQRNGLCGFIDRAGKLRIPMQYKRVRSFHDGFAAVQLTDGRWGYIDKRGSLVWEDQSGRVTMLGDFHEGVARVRGKLPDGRERWGYLNRAFRFAIDPAYEEARDFHDGLAAVKVDGRWGFITIAGRWAVQPRFEAADDFDDAVGSGDFVLNGGDRGRGLNDEPATGGLYAKVKLNGRWGFIDRTGRWVLVPQFEEASAFFRSLARVSRDDSFAYITERGKVVFDPRVALRLGFVDVSLQDDARLAATRQIVGGTIVVDGELANRSLGVPASQPPLSVEYPSEEDFDETLPRPQEQRP